MIKIKILCLCGEMEEQEYDPDKDAIEFWCNNCFRSVWVRPEEC